MLAQPRRRYRLPACAHNACRLRAFQWPLFAPNISAHNAFSDRLHRSSAIRFGSDFDNRMVERVLLAHSSRSQFLARVGLSSQFALELGLPQGWGMADIFISYAGEDCETIEKPVGRLAAGLSCWWDRQLEAGSR
jgi:hypothetical protein